MTEGVLLVAVPTEAAAQTSPVVTGEMHLAVPTTAVAQTAVVTGGAMPLSVGIAATTEKLVVTTGVMLVGAQTSAVAQTAVVTGGVMPIGVGTSVVAQTLVVVTGVLPLTVSTSVAATTLEGVDGLAKVLWLKAANAGAAGGSVNTWPDYSRAGHDAVLTSGATAPVVTDGVTPVGGKAVRFNGGGALGMGDLGLDSQYLSATASTDSGDSLGSQAAVDGSPVTGWWAVEHATVEAPQWLRVTQAVVEPVSSYTVLALRDDSYDAPADWTFEGTLDDGATWTVLDTRSGVSFVEGLAQTFAIATVTYASYRLHITATPSGGGPNIGELGLNGVGNGASAGEVWMVLRPDGGSPNSYSSWCFSTPNNTNAYPFFGGVYDNTGTGSTYAHYFHASLDLSEWRIYRVTSDGTWTASLDGVLQSTGTAPVKWTRAAYFGNTESGASGSAWAGDLAELIVRPVVSSPSEATAIYDYLRAEHFPPQTTGELPLTMGTSSYAGTVGQLPGNARLDAAVAAATTGLLPVVVQTVGRLPNVDVSDGALPVAIPLVGTGRTATVSSGTLPLTAGLTIRADAQGALPVAVTSTVVARTGGLPLATHILLRSAAHVAGYGRGSIANPYYVTLTGTSTVNLAGVQNADDPPIVVGSDALGGIWLSFTADRDGLCTVTLDDSAAPAEVEAWVGPNYALGQRNLRLVTWSSAAPVALSSRATYALTVVASQLDGPTILPATPLRLRGFLASMLSGV